MRIELTAVFIQALKAPENGQLDYWDARTPGFGLRVSKSGRKSWTVMYRFRGLQRRMVVGTFPIVGLSDARQLARNILHEVQVGKDPAATRRAAIEEAKKEQNDREVKSFEALANRFLEKHSKARKRTWRGDEKNINNDLLPRWRNKAAREITRRDVIEVLESIVDRGSGIQANRTKALISKIFNFGLSEKDPVVSTNPCLGLRNPTPERQRDRVLSEAEIGNLWKALDLEDAKIAAIFRLGLLTAQRSGEILGMNWSELDLAGGWWTIPAERSKNKLSHRIPLGPRAVQIIQGITLNPAESRYIFASRIRGKRVTSLSKSVKRLRDRVAFDFRFHDLRRTAASHMTGMGVQRLIVSKILNHVERDITAVYDRHSYDLDKQRALNSWARRVDQIVARVGQTNLVFLKQAG